MKPEERKIADLNRDRKAQMGNNRARIHELGVQVNGMMIFAARLEGLIDLMFGPFSEDENHDVVEGSAERLALEIAADGQLRKLIAQVGIARQQQAAAQANGGLVVPGIVIPGDN